MPRGRAGISAEASPSRERSSKRCGSTANSSNCCGRKERAQHAAGRLQMSSRLSRRMLVAMASCRRVRGDDPSWRLSSTAYRLDGELLHAWRLSVVAAVVHSVSARWQNDPRAAQVIRLGWRSRGVSAQVLQVWECGHAKVYMHTTCAAWCFCARERAVLASLQSLCPSSPSLSPPPCPACCHRSSAAISLWGTAEAAVSNEQAAACLRRVGLARLEVRLTPIE